MVRTFLKVYMELGSYFVSARTNKDIIIILAIINRCCPLRVVATRILLSFEFDGSKLFGYRVQSNSIQSSPPESFLILLFRHWRPPHSLSSMTKRNLDGLSAH
jgi:hypothetical protein